VIFSTQLCYLTVTLTHKDAFPAVYPPPMSVLCVSSSILCGGVSCLALRRWWMGRSQPLAAQRYQIVGDDEESDHEGDYESSVRSDELEEMPALEECASTGVEGGGPEGATWQTQMDAELAEFDEMTNDDLNSSQDQADGAMINVGDRLHAADGGESGLGVASQPSATPTPEWERSLDDELELRLASPVTPALR